MIGRHGILTAVEKLPGSTFRCVCDCGRERMVRVGHFNTGAVKSCGCTRFLKTVPDAHGPCIVDGCANNRCNSKGWCWLHYTRWRRHGGPLAIEYGRGRAWLEAHVTYEGEECLTWPFGRRSNGYGSIVWNGRASVSSRVMCELRNGPPPTPKHEAAHSCGKGHEACVNPNHLAWKTSVENQADKVLHGTHNRGENHPCAITNSTEVIYMRSFASVHDAYAAFPQFSRHFIRGIRARRTWKHV